MPGWRMGFVVGNERLVHALTRIKSYLDYGVFQPIQIASIIALNGPYDCVEQTVAVYKERRDALCRDSTTSAGGWTPPRGPCSSGPASPENSGTWARWNSP